MVTNCENPFKISAVAILLAILFLPRYGYPQSEVSAGSAGVIEIPAEVLEDKIRGGLLGQIIGNLNGLPHENKYYDNPGNVEQYTPALPDGARTDDDTDIEWVYVVAMQRGNTILLSPAEITRLWKEHINDNIWCSNLYVRRLMDIGIDPPLTGSSAINPWAHFNISGQFVCECFGLIAPAMPRTAGRIGLNYTHVSIDGEPAQTTQLFTAMIAAAFTTSDIDRILDAGLSSIDANSELMAIITDVRLWHKQYPNDWRTTRRLIKEKYAIYDSRMRNQNGYETCTAGTIAALLYGRGDFADTLRYAFNFGWDADNNAATAGAIVGVLKGRRWMRDQDWQIKDLYRNTTRPKMPTNETITGFGNRLVDLAGRVIAENGGEKITRDGKIIYRIRVQQPANIEPVTNAGDNLDKLRTQLRPQIITGLSGVALPAEQSRAAYLAICLGLADSLSKERPDQWAKAIASLNARQDLLTFLFYESPGTVADRIRAAALTAGITKPPVPKS